MNQNELAASLIKETLYCDRQWGTDAAIIRGEIYVDKAETVWNNKLVRINFTKNTITLNGKKLRLRKELSTDLVTLTKLFAYRILNLKHVPKNRTQRSSSI